MQHQDFTATITVEQTPEQAFNAITNVRGWWSEEIEGSTNKLGDEFTYHYQDVHFSRMKITELIPNEKVVWLAMDNHFNFTKDKTEWKSTKISFDISQTENNSQIRFTHLGLVPQYECYNICKEAWSHYINNSLYRLISTGMGQPNSKEGGFNQQLIDEYTSNNQL